MGIPSGANQYSNIIGLAKSPYHDSYDYSIPCIHAEYTACIKKKISQTYQPLILNSNPPKEIN